MTYYLCLITEEKRSISKLVLTKTLDNLNGLNFKVSDSKPVIVNYRFILAISINVQL